MPCSSWSSSSSTWPVDAVLGALPQFDTDCRVSREVTSVSGLHPCLHSNLEGTRDNLLLCRVGCCVVNFWTVDIGLN